MIITATAFLGNLDFLIPFNHTGTYITIVPNILYPITAKPLEEIDECAQTNAHAIRA